ncbi:MULTISPECIES: macro domain-containing protein [unclassified Mesorhizobium]|uniref:macro domain-containing protein n=1 Tax=unclassified Mesorhizobium TaxID=325217 RepID=UPI00112CDB9E|nr:MULTISPECIES: macro domain-containing protein [unclassified Mesorhizobium]MBZ9858646.1 macro domain-containing protein [Mesorhizobium sp. CA12]MBZ9911558.1 macro domain-containing protein [Mesorhizobium sp. CA16]TPI49986.1 macro domain-containing protein [Mesorhizobium sp. B2-9-1]
MITYLESSVFESPAQTLVNTVNTVGVMGKGIAKEFKSRYPAMFAEYRKLCEQRALGVGKIHLWRSDTRWVLNFPTKTTWKLPSKLEYIHSGLAKFVESYKALSISSASFPPLGCGNGNLNWADVKPVMEEYLSKVDIPIYIHDIQVAADFVPEHKEPATVPRDFAEFSRDIDRLSRGRKFSTSRDSFFSAEMQPDNSVVVQHETGKRERIDPDLMEAAWIRLRERLLSFENFSDEKSRRLKGYLFPILAELPYVRSVKIKAGNTGSTRAEALFIDRDQKTPYSSVSTSRDSQEWLFQ